jgi:gliding motility-associated-like protein
VTVSNGICTDTASASVTVLALPLASFVPSNTVCTGEIASFINTSSGASSFYWNFGNSSTDTAANPSTTYASAGNYPVTLIVTGPCGNDSITHMVSIIDNCCNMNSLKKLLPSAFSPNNDSQNDKFCVRANACIVDFVLKIYDRWGEVVFETNNFTECWDGRYKNKDLNTAVFVFYFEATLDNGEKFSQKGNVSLFK